MWVDGIACHFSCEGDVQTVAQWIPFAKNLFRQMRANGVQARTATPAAGVLIRVGQVAGGNGQIRIEADNPVDWYTFAPLPGKTLGFYALRLPKDMLTSEHFEKRLRTLAGFDDTDFDYYRYSHDVVRVGERLVCAAQRFDTAALWIWRSADAWRNQRPKFLGPLDGGAAQFFYAERFYLVGNGEEDEAGTFFPLRGYDYQGQAVTEPQWIGPIPRENRRDIRVGQGRDGRFYVAAVYVVGPVWTLVVSEHHVAAPQAIVRAYSPVTLDHVSEFDMPFKLIEQGDWLLVSWGKRTSVNVESPYDGFWTFDLWCFDRQSGAAVLVYVDTNIADLQFKKRGAAFGRRLTWTIFEMDPSGQWRWGARVYFGVDEYGFDDSAGLPELSFVRHLTDPDTVYIPVVAEPQSPGVSLRINTIDTRTGLVVSG